MLHFDFTLSDEEAQVLFDCISDKRNEYYSNHLDSFGLFTEAEKKWFGEAYQSLEELKAKLHHQKTRFSEKTRF